MNPLTRTLAASVWSMAFNYATDAQRSSATLGLCRAMAHHAPMRRKTRGHGRRHQALLCLPQANTHGHPLNELIIYAVPAADFLCTLPLILHPEKKNSCSRTQPRCAASGRNRTIRLLRAANDLISISAGFAGEKRQTDSNARFADLFTFCRCFCKKCSGLLGTKEINDCSEFLPIVVGFAKLGHKNINPGLERRLAIAFRTIEKSTTLGLCRAMAHQASLRRKTRGHERRHQALLGRLSYESRSCKQISHYRPALAAPRLHCTLAATPSLHLDRQSLLSNANWYSLSVS
jgi:hypothetical protein